MNTYEITLKFLDGPCMGESSNTRYTADNPYQAALLCGQLNHRAKYTILKIVELPNPAPIVHFSL